MSALCAIFNAGVACAMAMAGNVVAAVLFTFAAVIWLMVATS